jgi:hypothetical protein
LSPQRWYDDQLRQNDIVLGGTIVLRFVRDAHGSSRLCCVASCSATNLEAGVDLWLAASIKIA